MSWPGIPRPRGGTVSGRVVSLVVAGLLALAVFVAPARAADLRIALSSEPNSLDPHFHALAPNNNLNAHIFEALTRFDSDSRLVPALAESWRLVDETTWEFKLRKGVKFHDGSDLTAEDVAWSLDRPATITNSPGSFALYTKQIIAKQIVDPWTIRSKTAAPYPLMLNDLSAVFIVSRKSTQGVS